MAGRVKRDIDGDLVIAGNLTVLGGLNEKNFLKTRTELASTKQDVSSFSGRIDEAESKANAASLATYNYANNIAPTNNVTELTFTSEANADGSIDVGVSFKYTQGAVPAAGFLIYAKSGPQEPVQILASDRAAKFILASADAGEQTYGASLQALSVRYGGIGAVARVYHFAVVAVSQCVGGYIPCASGLVEASGWTAKIFVATITDIAIKSYRGQGVNRRAIKIDAESLDWIDAPDTTPASPELLRARIGRLGVGSSILMDGDFYGPITTSWGSFTTISGSYCNGGKYIKTSNGEIWVTYASLTSHVIYTKKLSGSTWGTQITVSTSGYSPVLCESNSGQLLLFYITTSNVVVYREWSGASWGSEVSTGITVYGSDFLSIGVLIGDDIRISTYSTSSSYLAEYHGSGTSWVSSGILSSSTVLGADYIVSDDGYQIIIYQTPTAIYQRILVGSSWGSETTVYTTSTGGIPVLVKEVNGYISLFCAGQKFVWQSPGWGSPVSSGLPTAAPTDIIQMNDGTWRCVQNYTDVGTNVVQESILIKYSQVGSGIIERGSNPYGSYIKFGDGTLIQFGNISPSSKTFSPSGGIYSASLSIVFPIAFYDTNYIMPLPTPYYYGNEGFWSGQMGYGGKTINGWASLLWSYRSGTFSVGLEWTAIGRWKA